MPELFDLNYLQYNIRLYQILGKKTSASLLVLGTLLQLSLVLDHLGKSGIAGGQSRSITFERRASGT